MLSKVIGVGDRVEFTGVHPSRIANDPESVTKKKVYISQVTDVIDETRIKVTMPIEGGHVVAVSVNTKLDVCFYTSKGLYHGRVVVVERMKENSIYEMVVELQYELKKYQRRQYYRLRCTMDVSYRLLEENEQIAFEEKGIIPEKDELFGLLHGVCLDFSGGGIRFLTQDRYNKNDYLFVKLNISYGDNCRTYILVGRVIASVQGRNNRRNYETRMEFVNISNKIREEIIKYIFMEERRQRKSESGL